MKLIITMSGNSKRFIDVGLCHKLFVNVMDIPSIELFLSIYNNVQNEDKFIIVNSNIDVSSYCNNMNIVSIESNTDGPVASIMNANLDIDENEEVVVSYSDFYMSFNVHMFRMLCKICNADGGIVTHNGFHPHRLYNNSFCYLRTQGSKVLEVKEKAPFTNTPMNEPASSGVYYFRSFGMMKKYFNKLIENNIRVNGEFYVTMPYNLMIEDQLSVIHLPVNNYMCLGTPEDIDLVNYTYKHWRIYD